ncbi:hypothetical protein BJ138DRAFT_1074033, partial [Hygrophoropsis aurantiaca]
MWSSLPVELQLLIAGLLHTTDAHALAQTSRTSHAVAVGRLFCSVRISGDALARFPLIYATHIRHLTLFLDHPTRNAAQLLRACTQLHSLEVRTTAPLDHTTLVPAFASLTALHTLHLGISPCATEEDACLSERQVVALTRVLPSLAHLSLDHVLPSRTDVPFHVPHAIGDDDLPDQPLSTLLHLPSLKTLDLHDTWLTPAAHAHPRAKVLDRLVLAGCMHDQDPAAPASWLATGAISHIHRLVLGAPLAAPA